MDQRTLFSKLLFCLILNVLFHAFTLSQTHAQTMTNGNFNVQGGNFNSFSGAASNPQGNKVSFTSGETGSEGFTGSNYKIKAGFQNINSSTSFTFSISSTSLNFGDLKPGEPVTRTNLLTISSNSAPGYSVKASENHEPQVLNGASIPDTTCDNGSCSQTTAAVWSSPLTYGFGYRCDNKLSSGCSPDFSQTDSFRQFSNSSNKEEPVDIMQGIGTKLSHQSQITYKINIPNTQPAGMYQNSILYIAVPSL
jgi:hypothetical protein